MLDDLMGEKDPPVLRDDLHQVLLDVHGIVVPGEVETPRYTMDVSIDHHTRRNAVSRSEDYVSRFACGARHGNQLVQCPRHIAVKIVYDPLRRADQRLRLVIEKTRRADVVSQNLLSRGGEIVRRRIFPEQFRRNFVYTLIGALRRKNSGHQQFPRAAVMQRARCLRVHPVKSFQNHLDPGIPLGSGLWPDHLIRLDNPLCRTVFNRIPDGIIRTVKLRRA